MPVPEQRELASVLHFDPSLVGDPPPWIWRIIQELDIHSQTQIVKVALDVRIAVAKAHVEGLQKFQEIFVASAKTR